MATLPNGDRVAVKVQRPGAEATVEADIALFYQVARLLKEYVRRLDFIDAVELVDEFARSMRAELDYRGEARNARLLRSAFDVTLGGNSSTGRSPKSSARCCRTRSRMDQACATFKASGAI